MGIKIRTKKFEVKIIKMISIDCKLNNDKIHNRVNLENYINNKTHN